MVVCGMSVRRSVLLASGVLLLVGLSHQAVTESIASPDDVPCTDEGIIVASNVPEPSGTANVCHRAQGSTPIQDIKRRCEDRYCCAEPCVCSTSDNIREQACNGYIEILTCTVDHLMPDLRFMRKYCCDGYEEHPTSNECVLITTTGPTTRPPATTPTTTTTTTTTTSVTTSTSTTSAEGTTAAVVGDDGHVVSYEDGDGINLLYIILPLVALLLLFLICLLFGLALCRRKKKKPTPRREPHTQPAYTNETYGVAVVQLPLPPEPALPEKLPLEGAVGYSLVPEDEKKKFPLDEGAIGYELPASAKSKMAEEDARELPRPADADLYAEPMSVLMRPPPTVALPPPPYMEHDVDTHSPMSYGRLQAKAESSSPKQERSKKRKASDSCALLNDSMNSNYSFISNPNCDIDIEQNEINELQDNIYSEIK